MFREFTEVNELREKETEKKELIRLCKEMMKIQEEEIPHRIKYITEYWTNNLKLSYNKKLYRFLCICNGLSKEEIMSCLKNSLENYKLNPDNLFKFQI